MWLVPNLCAVVMYGSFSCLALSHDVIRSALLLVHNH